MPAFELTDAWRALPGGAVRKGDRLFSLTKGCNGIWCKPDSVTALNEVPVTYVEAFGLQLQPYVLQAWIDDRVAQGRVLALGSFTKGTSFPGFDGVRVFLRVPEHRSCPQIRPPSCSTPKGATTDPAEWDKVATFTLDSNRCLFFAQCEEQGPCPQNFVQPTCFAGYSAHEFLASPGAYPALTCDPTWTE